MLPYMAILSALKIGVFFNVLCRFAGAAKGILGTVRCGRFGLQSAGSMSGTGVLGFLVPGCTLHSSCTYMRYYSSDSIQ